MTVGVFVGSAKIVSILGSRSHGLWRATSIFSERRAPNKLVNYDAAGSV